MGAVIFFGIIVLCLLIWLDYYVAKQFEAVANAKGHYGKRYFHLCFWMGMMGYLLVIALPDRGNAVDPQANASAAINDELPDLYGDRK